MYGDLVMPVTFSKGRDAAFGAGAMVGQRDVSKGLNPMPVKKAPTLARKGAQPVKNALVPKAPTTSPEQVGKLNTIAKAKTIHHATLVGKVMEATCGADSGVGSVSKSKVTCPTCLARLGAKVSKATSGVVIHAVKAVHGDEHGLTVCGKGGPNDLGSIFAKDVTCPTCKSHVKGKIAHIGGRKFSKAARYYDPEDRRQRRLGAAASGAGITGGLLARSGVKQVQRETRALHGAQAHAIKVLAQPNHREHLALQKIADNAGERGSFLIRPRAAGKIGLGATLVTGAGALMADHHKRRYS